MASLESYGPQDQRSLTGGRIDSAKSVGQCLSTSTRRERNAFAPFDPGAMRVRYAIRLAVVVCAVWCGSVNGSAQSAGTQAITDAANKGFKLNASGPVRVGAGLIPARISARMFGKGIAHNYAAVELTVSNKNHDSAFLIHSIYIDYGDWLLSGTSRALSALGVADTSTAGPAESSAVEATTEESQVASTEYRVARGEALDAQQWNARNWAMRSLTLLGVVATGSEFAFTGPNVAKGIGAFTGQVVPAAGTFWPDGSIAQIDRISDFGFRTNKVIPKESSDIVVAFFPLERFLTPGLKKIFIKSPAVFFLPVAGLVDDTLDSNVRAMLQKVIGDKKLTVESLKDKDVMSVLNGISMNRIRVKVGGVLVIDPDAIPARIDSVAFDGTPDFSKAGAVTGTVSGTLLSNGVLEIDGLTDVKVDTKNSTDASLRFTAAVPTAGLKPCSNVTFDVKKTKDGKNTTSNSYQYKVPAAAGASCPAS